MANDMADILLNLGFIFILGLFAHWLGLVTALPRVSLLILCGIAVGPHGIDLLGPYKGQWFDIFSTIALLMVGFLIGGTLTRDTFRSLGRQIITLSVGVVMVTFLVVFGGLMAIGLDWRLALLLGAIATATDPAAIHDVIREKRIHNGASKLLLGIVALDDAWGLLLFSFCLTIATGQGADQWVFLNGLKEVCGTLILGVALGLPMAILSGRLHKGEPTTMEALAVVFLAGGVALWLDFSYLLTAIALGATVANLAEHHSRPFHAIEDIQAPFLVLFFILAGASLNFTNLLAAGLMGVAFIALRFAGKLAGGWTTGKLTRVQELPPMSLGLALMPQAGVAVGIALISSQIFPEFENTLLAVTIAATVFFELLGPIATDRALSSNKSVALNDRPEK
ncbi:MAG: cation:proton antiporter [bacterium]